jgi:hypothetical protein
MSGTKASLFFGVENEGLSVGCAPNGPAKYPWVLGVLPS